MREGGSETGGGTERVGGREGGRRKEGGKKVKLRPILKEKGRERKNNTMSHPGTQTALVQVYTRLF